MRIALLTNILAPYRMPAFRALAQTPGWRLRIYVNAQSEFDRHWDIDAEGLEVETVPGRSCVRGGRTLHFPSPIQFFRALRSFRPEAVISAELGMRTFLAWLYCLLFQVPLTIWAVPTRDVLARGGVVRRLIGPALLSRARSVVVPGAEGRRAYRAWGVPEARLFIAPHCHDIDTYAKALARLDPDSVRLELQAALGCRPRIALVVGRLLQWKGIKEVLDAWDRLPPPLRRDWTLLFVGEGPEANRIDVATATHANGEIVHVPRADPEQLAELYTTSDLLVFPTLGEPWGIVVNEAMACSLPVLCSERAGCAEALILPGETGWLTDSHDENSLRDALLEALTCGRRIRMGERARDHIAGFTGEAMAQGFRAAVR
jgi:glycosyltransferase involved in cell wall biosynthesis